MQNKIQNETPEEQEKETLEATIKKLKELKEQLEATKKRKKELDAQERKKIAEKKKNEKQKILLLGSFVLDLIQKNGIPFSAVTYESVLLRDWLKKETEKEVFGFDIATP
jgi:hypothetical protein